MTKSKLSAFFDSLLISFIIFVLSYIWINKYLKNAILSFFICNIIFFILFFVIFKFQTTKYNLNNLKHKEQKLANHYLSFLTFSSDSYVSNYFCKLLNSSIILKNILKNKNCYFYINIKTELTSIDFHIANNFYQETDKSIPLIFLCLNCSQEFLDTISISPIKYEIFYSNDIYNLMKEKNEYPTTTLTLNSRFANLKLFKQKATQNLSKKHFIKFLFSGICLIIISIFIPFSFYYMIFGTILLILALACLFNKQAPIKNSSSLKSFIEK